MGKHSMAKTHKRTFNKTMAIALAAGVSFGGVQVVSAQTGHDMAGQAVAAETDGEHRNINNMVTYDSLEFFMEDGSKLDPNKKYEGVNKVKNFKGSGKIADGAKPGDQFIIEGSPDSDSAYSNSGYLKPGATEVTEANIAPGYEDKFSKKNIGMSGAFNKFGTYDLKNKDGKSLGTLDVSSSRLTFTLNENVSNLNDLTFSFNVPINLKIGTDSRSQGTIDNYYWYDAEDKPSDFDIVSDSYNDYYIYYGVDQKQPIGSFRETSVKAVRHHELEKEHFTEQEADISALSSYATGKIRQDLGAIDWTVNGIGSTAVNTTDKEQHTRTVFTLPDEVSLTREQIEKLSRPASDDESAFSNFIVRGYGSQEYRHAENKDRNEPRPSLDYGAGWGKDIEGAKFDDYVDVSINEEDKTITWDIRVPAKSKVAIRLDGTNVLTPYTPDLTPGVHEYKTDANIDWTSDKVTEAWSTDSEWSIDLGSAGADGTNIVRKPGLEAYLNDANPDKPSGKTADGKNSLAPSAKEAVVDNDGTADLTLALKNDKGSNVSLVNPTITLPDGKKVTEKLTLKPGETQYKTYKVDLSKFKKTPAKLPVSMQFVGAEKLTDEVWFTASKASDSIDPSWSNISVPDGGSKTIKPTGTKDAPKGTKYEITGDHPDWITINPDTGDITAKPPKGTKPGKNPVTVTTTFPDGSTDTDKPVITVIHNDVFIDGKPDVKPDGTVILHRNDGEDITFKVPTGSKVEVNKDGDLVITNPGKKPETIKLKHTTVTESGKPGTPDHKIIITDENGDTHEFGTYDKFLESIDDDGKGNYVFTLNDGTKVGTINLGDDVVDMKDDGKGNLIITHKDGSTDTVPLKHTTLKENGKPGEPGYSIELTTPDGKKVTIDGYDSFVESIEKQPNGDYLVKRNDGVHWVIQLSDIRDQIKDLKGKDAEQDKRLDELEDRVDGIDDDMDDLAKRVAANEGKIEEHRKSINEINNELGGIEKDLEGIHDELDRLDGQDIKEVRDNGDGTYTLIRNNGDEVTGTIDVAEDITNITDNGDGTITLTHKDGSTEKVDLTHTKVETKGKPGDKDYTVTITTPDGNKVTLNGSNTYPSKVKDNGDGTYTIILNDGTEVPGKIGDGQDIKELVPNEDGTMTIIHKDGSESKVDLKQVTITEQNKGTPEHTVTITSPNGDTVTFNVFDKYVTNVVKNENGDYDIYRSDINGGETVWKTIVLSDLRDKISALENRANKLEEKDADLQRQIDELKGRLDKAESDIQDLGGRTSDLEKAVSKINARLSVIELNITALETRMTALEGRVDTVETTQHAWAQCFSGVLGTAIPLLAAVPFIAGSNIQIPGAAEWNNQIQRTLGIYNEKLNRMAGQYSGVVKAAALVLGVAGTIGLGVHTAKACGPYSKTDAMKDTKAGQLSSKVTAKREGSSREK